MHKLREKHLPSHGHVSDSVIEIIIGKHFRLETDHNSLVSLLGGKAISDLPPRVQRFRIRLMLFDYEIPHIPGKKIMGQTHYHELL